jgi:ribonuclease HI
MTSYVLYFDGCSKGNPGKAGAGAVLYCNGEEIWSQSAFIGERNTNNEAEYGGLLLGLEKAVEMQIGSLMVRGDSMIVIQQMKGTFQCKSPNLQPLFRKAKQLAEQLDGIAFEHVPRAMNQRADQLSNDGLISFAPAGA